MGITIQYFGALRRPDDLAGVVAMARDFCEARGWPYETVENDRFTIWLQEERQPARYYTATGFGLIARPHPMCEPVPIVFRGDGNFAGCVKTQFAPAEVHVAVTELLREIEAHLLALEVSDESGYWETRDPVQLVNLRAFVAEHLAEHSATGRFSGPVVQDNGRIIDLQLKPEFRAAEPRKISGWPDSTSARLH